MSLDVNHCTNIISIIYVCVVVRNGRFKVHSEVLRKFEHCACCINCSVFFCNILQFCIPKYRLTAVLVAMVTLPMPVQHVDCHHQCLSQSKCSHSLDDHWQYFDLRSIASAVPASKCRHFERILLHLHWVHTQIYQSGDIHDLITVEIDNDWLDVELGSTKSRSVHPVVGTRHRILCDVEEFHRMAFYIN